MPEVRMVLKTWHVNADSYALVQPQVEQRQHLGAAM
jgi:hypothetical protein